MDVREKLVELLKTNACPAPFICDQACRYYGYGDCFPYRFADHLIDNGVTVQEWISVDDRLPEVYDNDPDWSVTVLFRTTQEYIYSGYRNIGRPQKSFYDDDWTPPYWLDESENLRFEEDEVTHWMPLPKPPKGE